MKKQILFTFALLLFSKSISIDITPYDIILTKNELRGDTRGYEDLSKALSQKLLDLGPRAFG